MNNHNTRYDYSYRCAIATFKVLLKLHVVLFQLLLIWSQIALLIKPG